MQAMFLTHTTFVHSLSVTVFFSGSAIEVTILAPPYVSFVRMTIAVCIG